MTRKMPQSQTKPTAPRGRDTEHHQTYDSNNATSSLCLCEMIVKLERTLTVLHYKLRTRHKKPINNGSNNEHYESTTTNPNSAERFKKVKKFEEFKVIFLHDGEWT